MKTYILIGQDGMNQIIVFEKIQTDNIIAEINFRNSMPGCVAKYIWLEV